MISDSARDRGPDSHNVSISRNVAYFMRCAMRPGRGKLDA
jgi:hypothetical protein